MDTKGFLFGIYPGGAAGTDQGMTYPGPANDPRAISTALDTLQGSKSTLLVRCYLTYGGAGWVKHLLPERPCQYLTKGRKLDLVLGYQPVQADLKDWGQFIVQQLMQYGPDIAKVQICEEPNLHGIPGIDGDSPGVREALIHGVIVAKEAVRQNGWNIEVGFNAVPNFDPSNDFWRFLGEHAPQEFYNSLDYTGLDFFPDVFRPVEQKLLREAVEAVVKYYIEVSRAEGKIAAQLPVHITENGWATSPERSDEKQAFVVESVIRALYDLQKRYPITHYEMFDLRDADSSNPDFFYQFGIMKDDYTAKPAFYVFQKLIAEMGV